MLRGTSSSGVAIVAGSNGSVAIRVSVVGAGATAESTSRNTGGAPGPAEVVRRGLDRAGRIVFFGDNSAISELTALPAIRVKRRGLLLLVPTSRPRLGGMELFHYLMVDAVRNAAGMTSAGVVGVTVQRCLDSAERLVFVQG